MPDFYKGFICCFLVICTGRIVYYLFVKYEKWVKKICGIYNFYNCDEIGRIAEDKIYNQ